MDRAGSPPSVPASNTVTHVIFDVDGLLLDTESIYTVVFTELCAKYGKEFTWHVKAQMMGRNEREAGQVIIDALQLPISVDEYISSTKERMIELFPKAQMMPGAEKLIRHLHAHSVPMALATGSSEPKMKCKTVNHGELFSLFQHVVYGTGDPEVTRPKPAPDSYIVCAARFKNGGAKPENVLVFEDAPMGVEAAWAAGMRCVWVPDPNVNTSSHAEKACLIIPSLEHFKPEQFGLPPFPEAL